MRMEQIVRWEWLKTSVGLDSRQGERGVKQLVLLSGDFDWIGD